MSFRKARKSWLGDEESDLKKILEAEENWLGRRPRFCMYRKSGGEKSKKSKYDLNRANTSHISGIFVFTAFLNASVFNVRTAYWTSACLDITADTKWRRNIPFAFQTVMLIFKFVGT